MDQVPAFQKGVGDGRGGGVLFAQNPRGWQQLEASDGYEVKSDE